MSGTVDAPPARRGRALALAAGGATAAAGIALAVWPRVTIGFMSEFGGAVMAVTGLVLAVDAAIDGRLRSWAFVGAVGAVVLGTTLAIWPGETVLVATALAGAWLVVDGMSRVFDTMATTSVRAEVVGNLLGMLEAILGILVIARPVAGARATAVLVGAGLVLHGVARVRAVYRPSGAGQTVSPVA